MARKKPAEIDWEEVDRLFAKGFSLKHTAASQGLKITALMDRINNKYRMNPYVYRSMQMTQLREAVASKLIQLGVSEGRERTLHKLAEHTLEWKSSEVDSDATQKEALKLAYSKEEIKNGVKDDEPGNSDSPDTDAV